MGDWKKHVVPDWVVDDYNSRVSEEDRLPIGRSHGEFSDSSNATHNKYYWSARNRYEREPKKYSDISEDFMCKFAMFLWLFLSFIFLYFIL